ncbi:MAG TPA: hypothetical protein VGD64_02900 [Acidisarcina sp.]
MIVPRTPGRDEANRQIEGPQDDGTRELLRWGFSTLAAGVVAALITKFVFGGIGRQGPHTNSGWLALMVAMMCLPFGFMLTLLGAAKWLRNYRDDR